MAAPAVSRTRLWAEFLGLFVGVPVVMAASFGLYPLFPVVLALGGVAALLLALTPGFSFAELTKGPVLGQWRLILGFTMAVAVLCTALVLVLVPGQFLAIPLYRPELWLMIMVLYPLLSAAPQELIYRPLFFRRYGRLFPGETAPIAVNALVFGLGHLFYMNPITIASTVVIGAMFGWVYVRTGSFMLVCVLHGLAGQLVFTLGLGRFFYHGAIG